jgi:hypothetical protein
MQQGTFNGIDTCNTVTYGRFDFNSKLSSEAEARSIFNHPDINDYLTKLQNENIISQYVEKGKRDFLSRYTEGINYGKFITGATFVNLENSIILQREMENNKITASYEHGDSPHPIRKRFKKFWSECLYPCQNMMEHGVMSPKVPLFHSLD